MMVILWDILEQIVATDILCQLRILKQGNVIFPREDLYFLSKLSKKNMNTKST